ncbi:M42 family metallopeptidase [Feifania hominis]|uniref:M20/M25/M40 family metallo-hydrolase n=1 Tax=Feifania hominis TaxID=2763660 RepID=A0A926DCQ3_9FIRM|nr:M20/M25/M40 family metallo-hydrolase [Feifania hominis]MBC8535786.1 M20/M25/M40 family metallo-hydrolase [Feifania hominis]
MDRTELREIYRTFTLTPAPSGYESRMAQALSAQFGRFTDDVRIDKVGNVIATFPGTDPSAPKVMAFSHMDSLGFIVRRIDDDGFIRVDRLGGIPEKVLPAKPVLICREDGTDWVPGVFGFKAHHITPPEEKYRVNTLPELYIDIGAESAEEVRAAGIEVGCPVVYAPQNTPVLNGRVVTTFRDNRSGCTALVKAASLLKDREHPCTVYLVGTVWEEFNLRGAMMANRTARADIALSVDGGGSGDTPDTRSQNSVKVGGGPVITKYNFHGRGTLNGAIANRHLFDLAVACAEREGIPVQRRAGIGGLTDSAYMQLENDGVAILDMGSPGRYAHSPAELSQLSDIEQTGELVAAIVTSLDASFDVKRF